jgi:TolB protein
VRTVAGATVLVALIAILVVIDQRSDERSLDNFPPQDVVNRIVYVSPLGQIVTVSPDGTDPITIAPIEGGFTWPTWSPNSRNIAFSAIVIDDITATHQSFLYRFNTLNGRVNTMFIGKPGATSLVANRAPHYAQWSPDNQKIAFIDSSTDGLKLYVVDAFSKSSARHLMDDGPIWFDWSQNSASLMVHRGIDHFFVDVETETQTTVGIDSDQFGHRVAVWTPNGDAITYLSGSRFNGYVLNVSSTDGEVSELVDGLPANATFQWSPDGEAIAVSDPDVVSTVPELGLLVFPDLTVYDAAGDTRLATIEAPVVSFFWSPDGTKIAFVVIAEDFSALEWHVLEVSSGDTWKLVDFRPSVDQLTVFQFFEQYVQSHEMWSPDSKSLVFAGTLTGRGRSISFTAQQEPTQVYVVKVSRQPEVYTLAEGTLAFWSPK